MFINYLLSHHKTDIIHIMNYEDTTKHYSVNINFLELFTTDVNLGNNLLRNPETILAELDSSLLSLQQQLSEENEELIIKKYIHARVYAVPVCPELHKSLLPGNEDLGSFLQVSGTVVRITLPKMLEFQRQYICTKCKYKIITKADLEQRYIITPPTSCTNPEACKSTTFITADTEVDTVGSCKDYQEIKIQEQLSKLGMGKVPNSIWITVEDDLVDVCKPGDNVTVCGLVKRRWKPLYVSKEIHVELFFKANHIQINNDNSINLLAIDIREQLKDFWLKYKETPFEARDIILKSISPEVFGLFITKLALAVVLAGGSQLKENENTVTPRSSPHLLLVGDPGTGKSQLLRFASKIIRRSVLTTGIGSTSAGLTCTAVMEDGEWHLEGGALVMADGGICCIDEFNSMKKQDRTSIHEAMEQQTISVAKAGVVCKLHTRCTVLAAMNPKSDAAQPFGMNINIASPLLSRFDLVLHLKDRIDEEWDDLVAEYVLNDKKFEHYKQNSNIWNIEKLQSYFIMIKQLNPVLTPSASQILSSYYQAQREIASRNKARTTVRLLDSLIRLSQGHARLMFHNEVQITDAVVAIILVESSLQGESSLLSLNDMNSDFPEDPTIFQNALNFIVLDKLGLMCLLDDDEEQFENKLSQVVNDETDIHEPSSNKSEEQESPESVILEEKLQQTTDEVLIDWQKESPPIIHQTTREVFMDWQKERPSIVRLKLADESEVNNISSHKIQKQNSPGMFAKSSEDWKDQRETTFAHCSKFSDESEISNDNFDSGGIKFNLKAKLSDFRFKPRHETTSTEHNNLNQMLNMIPSVTDVFNSDGLNLDESDDDEYGLL